MTEVWKDIPGYEDSYQISNYGRILNKTTGSYLATRLEKNRNRLRCSLSKDNKTKNIIVKSLVFDLFGEGHSNECKIGHVDGDPTNCRIDNLYSLNQFSEERLQREQRIKAFIGDDFEFINYIKAKNISHSKIILKCKKCGSIFSRYYNTMYQEARWTCKDCEVQRIASEKDRLNLKRLEREKQRTADAETRKVFKIYYCHNCGQAFMSGSSPERLFCSTKCKIEREHIQKEKKRIYQNNVHEHRLDKCIERDNSISLKELYRRDNGICWLCGKQCDWNDIKKTKKTMIAGEMYPSIDHVIPIAKGGQHVWSNVRLAHRKCNYEKRDRIVAKSLMEA